MQCNNCNTCFTKEHSRQVYCSANCRFSAAHKRKADYKREWNLKNKETVSAYKQKYANENKDKRKESTEKWRKANMSFYTEYASLRSRYQTQAKPPCLNEWDELVIAEIYDLARKRGKEVDHIIPIKHNKVCGLHVPWNMQLLTRSENSSKSNKFDEDLIAILTKKEPTNG